MSHSNSTMTIRRASTADLGSLALLASLDSARVPELPMLVAESEGRMLAAVPFDGGSAIADPFEHTSAVVDLLELPRSPDSRGRRGRARAPARFAGSAPASPSFR